MATAKRFPIMPAHPERVCWGCDKFCAANDMRCGNGSDRTMHPVELFGEGWEDWGQPSAEKAEADAVANTATPELAEDQAGSRA